MITNGYLLTADRIQRLNGAVLDHLQISIDNAMPDDVSKRAQGARQETAIARRARRFSRQHQFRGGRRAPQSGRRTGGRQTGGRLGFTSTVGIIHDREGQLSRSASASAKSSRHPSLEKQYSRINYFQDNIATV